MQNQEKIIQEYSTICKQIKELEEKKSKMTEELLNDLVTENVSTVKSDFGTLSVRTKKTYKYTDKVKEIEAQLKKQKQDEEEKNLATFTEKPFLVFLLK